MRCWAIEFELGGWVYEIPALPAVDWWPVLVSGDPSRVLDFVTSTPDDPNNLDDLLLSVVLEPDELRTVLIDAIEEAAGRSFHASFVLATMANQQWPLINGVLAQRGFRWDEQPLGAALDAIYFVVASRLEKDPLAKFLATLDNESLTTKKPTVRQRAKVNSNFSDIAGPRPTTGVRSTGAPSDSARPKTRTRPRPPRPAAP